MASIRSRVLSSGKLVHIVYYRDQKGRRHNKTFTNKKAADAWRLRTEVEVRDGLHTPETSSITIAKAAENWLERARRLGLERSTQQAYEMIARRVIVPFLGEIRLAQLTRPRVIQFRDELLDQFSYGRTRVVLGKLYSILENAMDRGEVAHNVAHNVQPDPRTRSKEDVEVGRTIPSREEMQRLLDTATGWFRVMLLTAVLTGMRQSELRGLYWDDIDFT
jgi:integrase